MEWGIYHELEGVRDSLRSLLTRPAVPSYLPHQSGLLLPASLAPPGCATVPASWVPPGAPTTKLPLSAVLALVEARIDDLRECMIDSAALGAPAPAPARGAGFPRGFLLGGGSKGAPAAPAPLREGVATSVAAHVLGPGVSVREGKGFVEVREEGGQATAYITETEAQAAAAAAAAAARAAKRAPARPPPSPPPRDAARVAAIQARLAYLEAVEAGTAGDWGDKAGSKPLPPPPSAAKPPPVGVNGGGGYGGGGGGAPLAAPPAAPGLRAAPEQRPPPPPPAEPAPPMSLFKQRMMAAKAAQGGGPK